MYILFIKLLLLFEHEKCNMLIFENSLGLCIQKCYCKFKIKNIYNSKMFGVLAIWDRLLHL